MSHNQIKEIELKAQYQILSELAGMFSKDTKHRAGIYVHEKLKFILKELDINYDVQKKISKRV